VNPARAKLPPLLRPLSPDKVLREQAPVRPGAAGALLPLDCSQLPGHISPAEAPIILSQPRTGKADFYELTWRPRHDGGAPVLEYMVKYRKVTECIDYSLFIITHTHTHTFTFRAFGRCFYPKRLTISTFVERRKQYNADGTV